MKTLVIVESPAKCKTISKYLGNEYTVKASFGHIRDLPSKSLGVDIENNFKPSYQNMPEKSKVIKELKDLAKKSDEILLASDPDREGEAIAWHLNAILKSACPNIKRITFNEITKPSVIAATQNKKEIDLDLVNSQQTRRILDRVVGYKLSPWLNKVISEKDTTLSAGRVQSVALKIIVLRENEILNFQKEEYWQIVADVSTQKGEEFKTELFAYKDEKLKIPNVSEAQNILNKLKDAVYAVEDVKKQEKKRNPYPPFTTSTLQQEANKKLNWDSTKVMKIAQELYEGVEVEENQRYGLITYMRTDSVRVNEDFQKETLDFIRNKFGNEYVPATPNVYKTKGEAQDAHEAIRPTVIKNEPDKIKDKLTNEQYLLYKLIFERFVGSQMINATMDTVSVIITANDYKFKTTGQTVKFDGFLKLYNEEKEESPENEKEKEDSIVPPLTIGEQLNLLKITPNQKFTSPPARYTEASLIKELEKLGVGRPSTYATIIQTLKKRDYVLVNKKKFEPTNLGKEIVSILDSRFTDIMDIKFTADMETQLDVIAEGKENWTEVISGFLIPFLNKLDYEEKELYKKMSETNQLCPDCGKPMVERQGKFGKFLACSGYPDCKKTIPIKENKTSDVNCEKCGKPMIIKEYNKKYFLACSGYPDCKNTINCDKNGKPSTVISDQLCPDCGKPMYLRNGSSGKFYGCSGYPDCRKTLPYIDPNEKTKTCPDCGKPLRLRTGAKGKFWGCTGYPDCKHTEPEK